LKRGEKGERGAREASDKQVVATEPGASHESPVSNGPISPKAPDMEA